MTVSASDIADALRWLWIFCGVVWSVYAWLHRVEYRRALLGIVALFVLDWLLHAFADFAEQPNSNIPSDFALYSVMMLLAGIVGLSATCLYARGQKMNVLHVLDAALLCVLVGGIGGRVYQVWTNWHFYSENKDLILELSHGGFGMRGALVFGFVALFLFAFITKNSFWKFADASVIGLSLAQSIGWYGAALTHAHYGIALDPSAGSGQVPPPTGMFAPLAQIVRTFGYNFVQDLPDAYNLIAFRIPVQMIAAIFFFALFLFLILRAREHYDGSRFTFYVFAASFANFVFGFWRGDETLMWNGLRLDQWLDLFFVIIGIALAFARHASLLQRARVKHFQEKTLQHA